MKVVCGMILIGLLQQTRSASLNATVSVDLEGSQTNKQLTPTLSENFNESVCGNVTLKNGEDYLIYLKSASGCQYTLPYFIRCSDYSYRMFESPCRAGKITYMIACGILGFLTTVGNIAVIVVFLKVKKLRNSQGIYKLSMAFTDLIFGVFIPPSVIISWQGGSNNAHYLSALGFITPFTTFSSMGNLIVCGIDRLLAITFSMRYRPWIAKRYAYVMVISVWCTSACISSLPFYVESVWFTYASTGTLKLLAGEPIIIAFLGVAIAAVYLNGIVIFIVVKVKERQAAKIWSQPVFRRNKQLAITLCIMILAFTSSTLPGMVLLTVNDANTAPLLTGEAIVVFIFMTNGFWNCIVYSFRIKEFREEFKNMCKFSTKNEVVILQNRTT